MDGPAWTDAELAKNVEHAAQLRAHYDTLPAGFVKDQMAPMLAQLDSQIKRHERANAAERRSRGAATTGAADTEAMEVAEGDSPTATHLQQLHHAGVAFRGAGDMVAVAIHTLIGRSGWVCTSKEVVPGAAVVPGFAPPLREQDLDPERPVPTKWTERGSTDGGTSFTYRLLTDGPG